MNQSLRDEVGFEAMIGDVTPLKRDNRADPGKKPPTSAEAWQARRDAAEEGTGERNFLSDDFVDLLPPIDPMAFRRDGIQQGVADKLKHGGYPVQAQLHLRRRPLAECRRMLFAFMEDAYAHDLRSILIVHGRGREIDSPANVLRSYLAKWLAQFEQVQAYVSAQPSDGGLGATWVMLRKSARAKTNNRERQQKRRG
ncbi:DNA endonuclease SmrA [Vreelandella subglaciescola]|uniref:DNA-nicking endonuclease, Smr domain n=1 Tax=Vreelandella subglaciescola TaxID=29571 RepID=A0A1M7EPG2_9GAMM|nr:DNA endonuclease SmrA [Halomonas subglaciescola]SHL93631.1 DNA-nicking endonuclease, Smr domain [Halomonas subglaciescola]